MSELVTVDGLQPNLVKDAGGKRESLNESPREWSYFFPHQMAWHHLHPCCQADTLLAGMSVGVGRGAPLLRRQLCDNVMDAQTGFSQLQPLPGSLTTLQKRFTLEASE